MKINNRSRWTIPVLFGFLALTGFGVSAQAEGEATPPAVEKEDAIRSALGEYSGCVVLEGLDPSIEHSRLLYNAAMCTEAASPCSTFKIANTLIGLDTGVLSGPEFVIKWDGVQRSIPAWNADQTLAEAFKNSTVWYYQEVARRIGPERMQAYLDKFEYGNRDITGGIDKFWLGSTLKISAVDQVAFLKKLTTGVLPLRQETFQKGRQVMRLEQRGQVTLYGKNGSDGDLATGKWTLGWFVGWLENEKTPGDPVYFAVRLDGGSGKDARRIAEDILTRLGHWPPAAAGK